MAGFAAREAEVRQVAEGIIRHAEKPTPTATSLSKLVCQPHCTIEMKIEEAQTTDECHESEVRVSAEAKDIEVAVSNL